MGIPRCHRVQERWSGLYQEHVRQQTSYTSYGCCAKMRTVTIDVCCAMLSYPYSADARQLAIDGRIRVPHIHLGDKTFLILLLTCYLKTIISIVYCSITIIYEYQQGNSLIPDILVTSRIWIQCRSAYTF